MEHKREDSSAGERWISESSYESGIMPARESLLVN